MVLSIAIIGAGPAGLTLARLLQLSSSPITVTVFENDASPTSRTSQGGTLDLHTATGLEAIRRCGLWDEFLKHARYEGEEMTIADLNRTRYIHLTESKLGPVEDSRPEVDREKLVTLLRESVDEKSIQWGKKAVKVNAEAGTIGFADGTSAGPFDLIVGADGAWSKARAALTDVKPHYSGIAGYSAEIQHPDEEHPGVSKLVGRGAYFSFGKGKKLSGQRMGDNSIRVALWLPESETWSKGLIAEKGMTEQKLKETFLEMYADWANELKDFIRAGKNWQPWNLYELPVGYQWTRHTRVTLIGDAAHLMTPFAGEGVNAAMKDALELSDAIIAAINTDTSTTDTTASPIPHAIETYETSMFPRAKKVQEDTMRNKINGVAYDAPVTYLLEIIESICEESGKDLNKGWLAWLPIKTLLWSLLNTVYVFGQTRRRFWRVLGYP